MNLRNLIETAINTNEFVKVSNSLKIAAHKNQDKITIKLFKQGSLIWTDVNTLDNIIVDLDNEVSNFG